MVQEQSWQEFFSDAEKADDEAAAAIAANERRGDRPGPLRATTAYCSSCGERVYVTEAGSSCGHESQRLTDLREESFERFRLGLCPACGLELRVAETAHRCSEGHDAEMASIYEVSNCPLPHMTLGEVDRRRRSPWPMSGREQRNLGLTPATYNVNMLPAPSDGDNPGHAATVLLDRAGVIVCCNGLHYLPIEFAELRTATYSHSRPVAPTKGFFAQGRIVEKMVFHSQGLRYWESSDFDVLLIDFLDPDSGLTRVVLEMAEPRVTAREVESLLWRHKEYADSHERDWTRADIEALSDGQLEVLRAVLDCQAKDGCGWARTSELLGRLGWSIDRLREGAGPLLEPEREGMCQLLIESGNGKKWFIQPRSLTNVEQLVYQ